MSASCQKIFSLRPGTGLEISESVELPNSRYKNIIQEEVPSEKCGFTTLSSFS
jgi:hypothetical protein